MDWKNKLHFGDNLSILRDYVADASIDLICLDPPFNSKANCEALFKEKSREESAAQITVFAQQSQLRGTKNRRKDVHPRRMCVIEIL